jgi:hypothetical protein
MAESPERDRLRLMTLRSIFGWIKPCNLIAIGTVGSLPLCGTVDLSVNLDAKHLVAWGHVHGDGIQGTGQDVPVATRATAYPHRSASQWQATDGGGVAQLGNANLVVNFVSQPTLGPVSP